VNRHKPTKEEVAAAAGVSHMTVSRVLDNFPYVRPATRKRVLEACRKLGYRRNLTAAALRWKRSLAIGVVVPTFQHGYYTRLLASIEETCRKSGYHIILIQPRGVTKYNPHITREELEFLLERQVDGLIIDIKLERPLVRFLKREGIPVVFIDLPPAFGSFSFVGTANQESVAEITNYLIGMGHQRIAFLAGPRGSFTSNERLAGYQKTLKKAGLKLDKGLIRYTDYHSDGGFTATGKLLSEREKSFSAIVCANDAIAMGALGAIAQKGLKVPQDISVVGFSGDEAAAYTVPPLTTMVQPAEEIGRKAVEIVLAEIKEPGRKKEKVLLPAKFLARSSVAPPKTT